MEKFIKKKLRQYIKSNKDRSFRWFSDDCGQEVSSDIKQVYLELTTKCNLSCKTCVRNSIIDFKPQDMQEKIFNAIYKELKKISTLERIVLLGFGEALFHPKFFSFLEKLKKINCKIVLITNALILSKKNSQRLLQSPPDEIYFSWDDDIQGNEIKIRTGNNADKFKENLEYFLNLSQTAEIKTGLEIVASKYNYKSIQEIIDYARSINIQEIIITNLFPYTEDVKEQILYSINSKSKKTLKRFKKGKNKNLQIRIADEFADRDRKCPFIERGTVFITSTGNVATCPELAYDHHAYYLGSKRLHQKKYFGNILKFSLEEIWKDEKFVAFRNNFISYEFPDCTLCVAQDNCWHRSDDLQDCYYNDTPCGECLWAKNIVICP